ncbi:hypothetical protein ACH4D5_23970 [Streptomyces sp. NPDC018029]|uniref:hypothetical protein n=1 Tax=Streptomyces sp. NPDC018029 TaxID=3365032 RepID=UPI003799116A
MTFAIGIAAVGCSSPPAEYSPPDSLCGIAVPARLLKAVLPAGQHISVHPTSSTWNKRCRLRVDGREAFSATVEWWGHDTTLRRVAEDAVAVEPFDEMTKDHRYIYSNTGAVGTVNCPNQGGLKDKLFASVRVTHDDAAESDMKKLITAYTESAASPKECTKPRL